MVLYILECYVMSLPPTLLHVLTETPQITEAFLTLGKNTNENTSCGNKQHSCHFC